MPGFRKIDERLLAKSSLLELHVGTFESPDGERFERDLVHHPGAVVIVPVTGDSVVMVRQYRAAVDAELLEIPAGKRDVEGEATEVTAARELAEEVGRSAGRLDLLARFYNSPGFSDELSWCYLARDLRPVPGDLQGVEEQYLTVVEVSFDDIAELIVSGAIIDAKTIIGVTLAQRHLDR